MFSFPIFAHLHALGLDIQSDQITLLYTKKIKKKWQIVSVETERMPSGVIFEGKVVDSARLIDKLKIAIARSGVHGRSAVIAVPGSCVLRRDITLPCLASDEEYAAEMDLHIDKYLPGITGELRYDYQLQHYDGSHQHACLVAARSEIVDEYVRVVQESGLDVVVVDVDGYALARAMVFYVKNRHRVFGWVDVNSEWIRIYIFNEANIIFEQHIAHLGDKNDEILLETIGHYVQRSVDALSSMRVNLEQFFLTGKINDLHQFSEQLKSRMAIPIDVPDLSKAFVIPSGVKQKQCNDVMLESLTSVGLALRMCL